MVAACDRCSDAPAEGGTDAGEHKPAEQHATETKAQRGDLDDIKKRGKLRILVFGAEEARLPRRSAPSAEDREAAVAFARSLGVEPVLVWADAFDQLLPLLAEGRADLAAARLTVTDERKRTALFTRPLDVVSEVLVAREGEPAPSDKEALKGVRVPVRASSSWGETLRELGAVPEPLSGELESEEILERVADGKLPLTVSDSDVLVEVQAYRPELRAALTLREGRHIAWAVRDDAPALLEAANEHVLARALKREDPTRRYRADLDDIKKRGVLRVLTRNNAATYFLHRGEVRGFDYELMERAADKLGVRLQMIVPPAAKDLIPWLEQGRGDVVAAAFTVTDERAKKVAFSTPYLWVDEVLVHNKGASAPTKVEELAGRAVTVRPRSSYAATLRTIKARGVDVIIEPAPPDEETEEIIAAVGRGEHELTVADEHIAGVEVAWRDDVALGFALTAADEGATDAIGKPRPGAKGIAFAVRKDATALRAWLDEYVKETYRGTAYNLLRRRYFDDHREVQALRADALREAGQISPFDELFREAAKDSELDWRLLAAVAYQESHFDPKAKSWAGARGLFQIMPATFAELGGEDPTDPAQSTRAAARYLAQLIGSFDPKLPLEVRVRFALASYNVGRGHVNDARRVAEQLGKDPARWFDNTEEGLRRLSDPRYYRRARFGYCRAAEPIAYVREIQERYEVFVEATSRLPSGAQAPHKG